MLPMIRTPTEVDQSVSSGFPPHGPPSPSDKLLTKTYLRTVTVLWILVTFLSVLDRFTTNVSPRQSFSSSWSFCLKDSSDPTSGSSCGNDYYCEDDAFCLKEGPWSVAIFDIISRSSGRIIITTTSLLFLTMCRNSFNILSVIFPRFLWNVQEDNMRLHVLGGKVIGVCTVLHVWSLLLPTMFHSYSAVIINKEPFSLPAQVSLGTSQISNGTANWGLDDLWRIFWMTLIFIVLFPLSRSAMALQKNFNLAMWLHVGAGIGFFIDSARRRTHPHVWIYNLPIVLFYFFDRLSGMTWYRFNKTSARVFALDEHYQVVLWKHGSDTPRGVRRNRAISTPSWARKVLLGGGGGGERDALNREICDIYRMKEPERGWGEFYHPFTCASNRTCKSGSDRVPTLDQPRHSKDPSWFGHKFRVESDELSSSRKGLNALVKTFSSRGRSVTTEEFEGVVLGGSFRNAGLKKTVSKKSEISASATAAVGDARMKFQRQPTEKVKSFYRKLHGGDDKNDVEFDQMAIVRIHNGGGGCIGHKSETKAWAKGGSISRSALNPMQRKAAAIEETAAAQIPMLICGPLKSEYSCLKFALDEGRPLLVACTGAGAGLACDILSYIRGGEGPEGMALAKPVTIMYCTTSLALLQFVSNNLLVSPHAMVDVKLALTRVDGKLTDPSNKGGLEFHRLDMEKAIQDVSDESTIVAYCGNGTISDLLCQACQERGIEYIGAAVEG